MFTCQPKYFGNKDKWPAFPGIGGHLKEGYPFLGLCKPVEFSNHQFISVSWSFWTTVDLSQCEGFPETVPHQFPNLPRYRDESRGHWGLIASLQTISVVVRFLQEVIQGGYHRWLGHVSFQMIPCPWIPCFSTHQLSYSWYQLGVLLHPVNTLSFKLVEYSQFCLAVLKDSNIFVKFKTTWAIITSQVCFEANQLSYAF